ncbi:MAG: hypothetical protein MUC59_19100, partial [Saprospiraceae bacterium]|nr:hypothetical protein [Saprospiraceae bacterium]
MKRILTLTLMFMAAITSAQVKSNHGNKFEQLEHVLPDPTPYRGVDGAPGPEYWQQRCDYKIDATL